MKLVRTTLVCGALAMVLSACSAQEPAPASQAPEPRGVMEAAAPGEGQAQPERSGSGTGTIMSFGSKGDFVTIDHGPIEGMMGAMTMGFELVSDVDMSALAEGDTVAFSIKQGRDGVYRVTSICKTMERGAGCSVENAVE